MVTLVVAGVITVVFLATGTYALLRYVRISAHPHAAGAGGEARAVELLHLVMSLAMIAMAWGATGGPATASGVLQLVVFGVLAVVFGGLAIRARTLPHALSRAAHAVMAAGMVWMVATMPLLMGPVDDVGGGGHGGHAGHAAADASMPMPMPPPAPVPGWVVVGSVVLAAVLVAAGARWIVRVVRALRARRAESDARLPAASAATAAVGDGAVGGAVATLAPAVTRTPPRSDLLAATCHAAMSLAMAAMVLAML